MTTAIQTTNDNLDQETMLALVGNGDTSKLSAERKIAYYNARCTAAGLDPRTQPFQFVKLQGGEKLYATKTATDQLAGIHGCRTEIVSQATEQGVRVVTVRVTARDGRQTEEIGAVPVEGLKGEALANAMMKALTKAKRRAVLSVCGLGMLDETEVETIAGARPAPVEKAQVSDLTPTSADLWRACLAKYGPEAKVEWTLAVEAAGIPNTTKSSDWTREQIGLVEQELFGGER